VTALARSVLRFDHAALFILFAVVLGTAAWAAQPYPVGVYHDDGVYVVLGKAIATGQGYRYLNLPEAPVATHYPPAYPLLLAALWKLSPEFPRNTAVFQMANAILLGLAALGVAAYVRRVLNWRLAAAIVAGLVATVAYPLLGLSGHVLSETMFAAALLPALIIAERAAAPDARARDVWIAGAVAGLVALIRTHGAVIVAALALVLLLRRRPKHAAYAAAAAVLVMLPWQLWIALHDSHIVEPLRGKYASYGPWLLEGLRGGFAFVWATLASNVREVIALFADRFSLSDHAAPRQVTGVVVAGALIGGAFVMRRRAPVTVLFAFFYAAVLLLWPFTPWRFLYGAWPLVVILLGCAAHALYELRPRTAVLADAGLITLTVLALGSVRQEARAYNRRAWYEPARLAAGSIAPLIRWVSTNTAPADVIAIDAEQVVYLFTGRRAVPPAPFTAAEYVTQPRIAEAMEALRQMITQVPVKFLATVNTPLLVSANRMAADTTARTPRLVKLQSLGHGAVYRVDRDSLTTHQ
jgi:hypothetical protein